MGFGLHAWEYTIRNVYIAPIRRCSQMHPKKPEIIVALEAAKQIVLTISGPHGTPDWEWIETGPPTSREPPSLRDAGTLAGCLRAYPILGNAGVGGPDTYPIRECWRRMAQRLSDVRELIPRWPAPAPFRQD